jgi:hypothetical protein
MAATETMETIGAGLTFEKVWAALMENREQMKATDELIKATDEQIKATGEQMKATDERIKAGNEELRASIKAVNEQIGKLGNRFGEMVEYMVVPNLVAKFRELEFTFEKSQRNTIISDQESRIIAEIDVFLENGDRTMVVETKVKPRDADIDEHIERMEKLRRYADSRNDKRKYLGAVAGVVFGDNVKTYALRKGFYVIEPSSVAECLPSKVSSSRFSVLKKDSAHALSQQFPFRLMLWRTVGQEALKASRKFFEQYCDPRSEWNSRPSRGAVGKGHPQGGNGRMGRLHIAAEGPANDFPVIKVQHHRQVYPPA